ncbi:hypothetical protein GCM10012280_10800 [Wenjunlia tyrosinilytica]|uniref:Orc1-like AAA ATPase domain-containing protein n=1 Tax=Wenjunlia tyrosinilytica TaxID=1544741 RepID=A0A918DUG6_9ACTN|nr:hypothetical protein GCM10012280_10800 [Wenjunlia tyrosinilytica]
MVCLPIDTYRDAGYPGVPAGEEAAGIGELLAPLGARTDQWRAAEHERTLGAVIARLDAWSRRADDGPSMLYWVGHGESTGQDAWLAAHDSTPDRAVTGVRPQTFADAIADEWLEREAAGPAAWAAVVVEACGAERFVQLVLNRLTEEGNLPQRLVLVGSGGMGAGELGAFRARLREVLASFPNNDESIPVHELFGRLESATLRVHALHIRDVPPLPNPHRLLPAAVTAPVDTHEELQELLRHLPQDERGHFVPKAQGAEHGELSWYFEGRVRERAAIAAWLRRAGSGMLVVCGPAGAGKSALLGNVLIHTNDRLRELLVDQGRLTPLPEDDRPPSGAFDAVLHLAGATVGSLVERLAEAIEASELSEGRELGDADSPDGEAADGPGGPYRDAHAGADTPADTPDAVPDTETPPGLDRILSRLASRSRPFTILADALDEAQEPGAVAAGVLGPLSRRGGVRVLVGTRPRAQGSGQDLLTALGGGRDAGPELLRLSNDPEAVAAFVSRRLRQAEREDRIKLPSGVLERVTTAIRGHDREFLFARLAVHEILARPGLLTEPGLTALTRLLTRDHRGLFALAVARLDEEFPWSVPLLRALSLALGRGLPRAERIWGRIAEAVADGKLGAPTEEDVDRLLRIASPYVLLDTEDGRSVYRLAHRTFQEHFETGEAARTGRTDRTNRTDKADRTDKAGGTGGTDGVDKADGADGHTRAARALLAAAREALPAPPDPYIVRHLSGHVARAGVWGELAALPRVLDRLDPGAVAADAVRGAFGRAVLPPEIAAVMSAHQRLQALTPRERAAQREVTMTRHTPAEALARALRSPDREPVVAWASTSAFPAHLSMRGHDGVVQALARLAPDDGRILLASAGSDGSVRLWDPPAARPVGEPLRGHRGGVLALTSVRTGDGRVLLASGGSDTTVRLWDPVSGTAVGEPLDGHRGGVRALARIALPDGGTLLASGSGDGTIRLWDPGSGQPLERPALVHGGPVRALVRVPSEPGRVLLASGGEDGTVRFWDVLNGRPAAETGRGHIGAVLALAPLVTEDGRVVLASGGDDGTMRLWSPGTGRPSRRRLRPGHGVVHALAGVRLPDGRTAAASGGADGTIRIGSVEFGGRVGTLGHGRAGAVHALEELRLDDGRVFLASGHEDGGVRLWNPSDARPASRRRTGSRALAGLELPHGRHAVAIGYGDGTARLADARTGARLHKAWGARDGSALSLASVRLADGRHALATGHRDGCVRMWDPATGERCGPTLPGCGAAVRVLAELRLTEADTLLAAGCDDGSVHLWDTASGRTRGAPRTAHRGWVRALCGVEARGGSMLLSGGDDGAVRRWNPATGGAVGPATHCYRGAVRALVPVPFPGGRTVLASTDGHGIGLLDPLTGLRVGWIGAGRVELLRTLALVPVPGGRALLASGGEHGSLRLWDPVEAATVTRLFMSEPVHAMAAAGNRLVVAHESGVVAIGVTELLGL